MTEPNVDDVSFSEKQKSAVSPPGSSVMKRESYYDTLEDVIQDQDTKQRINVYISFFMELYRVLMGSMLLMFVPQKCGDDMCSLTANLGSTDEVVQVNIAFNFTTLVAFFILYCIEMHREHKLIAYLDVNKEHPTDNESVGKALTALPEAYKNEIWDLDRFYQLAGYVAMGAFCVNSGFSGYSVFNKYLDDKTTTVFITNILFLATKLGDVYANVRTKKNIFYSAYLTNKVQFNHVDEDNMIVEDETALTTSVNEEEEVPSVV